MKVIIIGGGIGGLTTALSLHEAGIETVVFDAAPRIEALGLGVNLQPNAVRELTELGMADTLAELGHPIEELTFFSRRGQKIWSEPRGLAAGYRWPQYAINRGQLQVALYKISCERLGADRIITDHQCAGFEQDENGVVAHFVKPGTKDKIRSERGTILIGADGLHSYIRQHYYPQQKLHFAGQLMWRTSIVGAPFLGGKTMAMIGHRDHKVVAYPMRAAGDNQVTINFIAELGKSGDAPPREDWNRKVDKSRFADQFASWDFEWLSVPSLIEKADVFYEFPKIDRDPVDRWTFDRVTLLGDAAHPMQPVGSQAGSQAIVDARVLVHHLGRHRDDPKAALAAYEAERLPPMSDVARRNRNLGAEAILDIVEERAPGGFSSISDVIPEKELVERSADFKHASGQDAQRLNERASYAVR